MLTLEQISQNFRNEISKRHPKGIMVEYLQHEILDSLFKNKEARALSFIGGTSIRIIHQSSRFSEALDFDHWDLSFRKFELLLEKTCKDMRLKGFLIEYQTVRKGAYHCYIRFPELLFKAGLTGHQDQKILIRIDSEAKEKIYQPVPYLLNRFSIYRMIHTAPVSILLAQKMFTILERKREKGRDLFDVSFLLGMTKPDFDYVQKTFFLTKDEFIQLLRQRIQKLDLDFLAKDVSPFLLDPQEKERILTFREYFNQLHF